jgi:hypothetical protein
MATETDKTPSKIPSPADEPIEPSEPFIPGPDSGLRNPPSAIERGLKEAADVMHDLHEPVTEKPHAKGEG